MLDAAVQVWILGASGGSSATVAGERGLRFAAGYHRSPSTVIDAVDASGYGLWVRGIREGSGAIAFPTPAEPAHHEWTAEDRELVRDRTDTQLVGSPRTVADKLEQLRDAAGAHELALTTITHDHADRVRSYGLPAEDWARRG